MSRERSAKPFFQLGSKLKSFREKERQSLAEVSGAVEIDDELLEKIEAGEQRPSEDILLLMISHFDIKDDEAASLWELAGYTDTRSSIDPKNIDLAQPLTMLVQSDPRVVYTDGVHVMVNDFGVVMNFVQNAGTGNQPIAVARVGMSKEHAQSIINLLQKSLHPQSPKALPQPKNRKKQA